MVIELKILLIEDDESITESLRRAFEEDGETLTSAIFLKSAERYLVSDIYDIVILDVLLPDGDGFSFYERVLKEKNIPTIFLTAKDGEEDIVKGLSIGAEDYVKKPFLIKELKMRVQKIYLRCKKATLLRIGTCTFDIARLTVKRHGTLVKLTALELKILEYLAVNRRSLIKREVLLDKIWEWTGHDVDGHALTVYINRIRGKLGEETIETIKGLGYRLHYEDI